MQETGRQRLTRLLLLGAIILVGVFLLYTLLFKKKAAATTTGSGQTGATDANGNPLVEYIPTSTSYTNVGALNYAAQGDAQQVIPLGNPTPPAPIQQTVNVTTPPSVPVPPPAPVTPANPPIPESHIPVDPIFPAPPERRQPPPAHEPPPAPPPRQIAYTIVHGDTLSAIAAKYHTSWQNLYANNKTTIDRTAAARGNPIAGGAANNIFPGEVIYIPQ